MALLNPSRAPAVVRRTVSIVAPTALRALLELGLVVALFELYRAGRTLSRGESAVAKEHALQVHHLERVLHLPSEATVQGLVPWDSVLHAANVYYFSVHFPTMIAFLVWGYLFRPRAEYHWARNLAIALTCSALVVHVLFPLAPPRMFPQWGFVDTMAAFGPNAYAGTSGAMANQFAAMPSLHIGWAALIAYVIHRTGPRWLAWVATAHFAVTVLVVVVTANHYWLDGMVAVGLLGVAVLALPRPATVRKAPGERDAVLHLPHGDD
jgi:PAP2 superfamily protein